MIEFSSMPLIISGVEIQERDWKVIRGLFEARVMTLAHISAVYFDGKSEMAKKRLQKLKAAGLVKERPRTLRKEKAIHFLSRMSFKLLRENGKLDGYPNISINDLEKRAQVSIRTIAHELEVMDVRVAIECAIRKTDRYSVEEISTWPRLYEFEACDPTGQLKEVEPDGFIQIYEKAVDGKWAHTYFLEVDRSKEGQRILVNKAHCYQQYRQSGDFARRIKGPDAAPEDAPFRVLFVLKNAERRNITAGKLFLNNPPINTQVWLTTMQEILADPLGPIWIRPVEYRQLTVGTAFDPYIEPPTYRTRPEREAMVEARIVKRSLLDDG